MIANFVPNHFFEFTPNSLQSKPTAKRNMTERVFDSDFFPFTEIRFPLVQMSVFVFSAITFSACAVLFKDVFGEIFLFMRERERESVREYDLYGFTRR